MDGGASRDDDDDDDGVIVERRKHALCVVVVVVVGLFSTMDTVMPIGGGVAVQRGRQTHGSRTVSP